jgi:hypothetical protein
MRIASFEASEGKAKTAIIVLGGQGGGKASVFNMWRSQLGLEAISEGEMKKSEKTAKGALGEFSWFELEGKNHKLLAAMIPLSGATAFVKMTAPKDVAKKEKENFLSLCKSVKKK